MISESCVYHGHVYHKRMRPTTHSLRYRVFSMYLDIDTLDKLAANLHLFSRNKWNIFGFHDQDFVQNSNLSLRHYVESELKNNQFELQPAKIRLLCYPRMLGYAFNPLAVFYCEDNQGRLFAVLHQVRNTFGESDNYVLPVDLHEENHSANQKTFTQNCTKSMHVSPFTPMRMQYHFKLNKPAETMLLTINANDQEGLMLTATINGKRTDLSDLLLLKYFFLYPLMTFKVIGGIHWEALKLWLKRVPWFPHQPKLSKSDSAKMNFLESASAEPESVEPGPVAARSVEKGK